MKYIEKIKKIATSILLILVVFLSAAVWMQSVCLQKELEEIKSQTNYLIDSDTIMQSQLSNMMCYVDLLQQGEDSLIEEQSIRVVDMNFETGKYQVEIAVIPKEYSDTTKLSVFFGVNEVPLTFKQYRYVGSTVLSLEDNYDGNVTYLFAEGDKKQTEIISDYQDLSTQLETLLGGEMMEAPVYQNGSIQFDSEIWYALNELENYEYNIFQLILRINGEQHSVVDIDREENGMIEFIEKCEIKEGDEVQLLLHAQCENGLCLEHDLFVGRIEEELVTLEPEYRVYDKEGNIWERK